MTLNLLIKWEEKNHLVFKCKDFDALTENKLSEEGKGVIIKSTLHVFSQDRDQSFEVFLKCRN